MTDKMKPKEVKFFKNESKQEQERLKKFNFDCEIIKELNNQQKTLRTLFVDKKITKKVNKNLNEIYVYYRNQILAEQTIPMKQKKLKQEHGFFLERMQGIAQGNISAEEEFKNAKIRSKNRKLDNIYHNILNTCKLLGWLAVALASYGLYAIFGIPLLFTNFLLGAVITITAAAVAINSGLQGKQCFNKCQSFSDANEQEQAEQNVILFLANPKLPRNYKVSN